MEPYRHRVDLAEQITAPVSDLGEVKLAALLAEYDLVKVAMWDGNWTRNIQLFTASAVNRGRIVSIDHNAGYNSTSSSTASRSPSRAASRRATARRQPLERGGADGSGG